MPDITPQTPGVADHARPDRIAVDRPNPLQGAALTASALWASLSGVVGGAVTLGLLTGAQAQAINDVGVALPGWVLAVGTIVSVVIPAGAAVLASFRTAAVGRDAVTPTADPRDDHGVRLVPVTGRG